MNIPPPDRPLRPRTESPALDVSITQIFGRAARQHGVAEHPFVNRTIGVPRRRDPMSWKGPQTGRWYYNTNRHTASDALQSGPIFVRLYKLNGPVNNTPRTGSWQPP